MQRLRNSDRGAVAVLVALLMPVFLILAALAIDVAAMYSEKQQLQNGADAAALAVAQDCTRNKCLDAMGTALEMVQANKNNGQASATFIDPVTGLIKPAPTENDGTVTVRTQGAHEHWFAPIIGIHETTIRTQSSAQWGYPVGGTAVMPLVLSWCELQAQVGVSTIRDSTGKIIGLDLGAVAPTPHTIYMTKSSRTDCTGPSNLMMPGGFGWVTPDGLICTEVTSEVGDVVSSDPGNSPPNVCQPRDFSKWIGQTVLLPVFDAAGAGTYKIFGYAAFTLTGFNFAGQFEYPTGAAPCRGNERCIRGTFDRFIDLTDNFDYSPNGPRLGAAVVALTQ